MLLNHPSHHAKFGGDVCRGFGKNLVLIEKKEKRFRLWKSGKYIYMHTCLSSIKLSTDNNVRIKFVFTTSRYSIFRPMDQCVLKMICF